MIGAAILAGGGASGAAGALRSVAERLGAPVLTTTKCKGAISEDHPLRAGCIIGGLIERKLVSQADLIVAVGLVLTGPEILASENGTGLVTADAMAKAMNSATMAKVIIIGGRCGIITSWNSFLMGGSRALYSMAESYMVPKVFAKLHPQYKTPVNALYLIGFLSILAPF